MASRLPSDFRKLEEETVDIARKIRVQMIEDSQTKGQLLSDVLEQENIQRKTEYGAAYEGFFALICEDNIYKNFKKQIDFILSKPIAQYLDKKQQNFLHSLTEVLVTECDRVRKIRNRIDENLRSYLESADYRENQIVTSLISKLEQDAVKFKNQDFNLYTKEMNLSLDKAGVKVSSVESIGQALKVPDKEVTLGSLEEHENSNTISSDILKQLDTVRLSDVRSTIRSLIGKTSQMSVGEIIKKVNLRYGLEEIVAFVRVAREMNKAEVNESEEIIVKVPAQNGFKELKVKLPKDCAYKSACKKYWSITMSDFVNDNIDALINSLEKTGHKNKANSDALKNSFKQEQNHQNSDEKLESSQNRSRECSIRTDATKIKEHLSYLWLWQKLVMVKSILVKT